MIETTLFSAFDDRCECVTLPLTTGEARAIARQLVALADRIDLATS